MARVTVYSTASCPICAQTKTLLGKWAIDFDEVMIDGDASAMQQFVDATNNAHTVPQIVIDGNLIGGFSELTVLHMDGELDELMQSN